MNQAIMSEQEKHQEIMEAIRKNELSLENLRKDVQPMIDIFSTLRALGKWVAILVAFMGSLTALALGVKALFKK